MSKNSIKVKEWRKRTKKHIIEAMGGKCQICSYNKCDGALDLHHIDPSQKDFAFGKIRSTPKSWATIVIELRKCILLCCRCHRELHDGVVMLPDKFATFNIEYTEYKELKQFDKCSICGKNKPINYHFCSLICAGKAHRQVDWDNVDLFTLLKTKSKSQIAEKLGISEAAVRKRFKKLTEKVGFEPTFNATS